MTKTGTGEPEDKRKLRAARKRYHKTALHYPWVANKVVKRLKKIRHKVATERSQIP